MRSPFAVVLAFILFFCSGAAALVYEVSWARQFGDAFGHTVQSSALVLFSYLGGLALGYGLAGRRASRRPLAAYGALELGAAAWACAVPTLLGCLAASPLGSPDPGPWALRAGLRAACSFALLLPATAALGATWPRMAAYLTPRWLGWGYAFNTAGALAGTLLATVYLLPVAGVRTSSFLAAGAAAGCGLAALALSHMTREAPPAADEPAPETLPNGAAGWLALAALSGFALLALQVLYLRLFSLVFHNSTYTFGVVLAVFLLALAAGTALVAAIGSRAAPAKLAALASGAGAVAVVLSIGLFIRLTGFKYVQTGGGSLMDYLWSASRLVVVVVLPPVTLLGMLLPLVWRACPGQVGGLTAANALASAAGALAASFVLLPGVGLWGAFAMLAGAYALASGSLLLSRGRRWVLLVLLTALGAVLGWTWATIQHTSALRPGDTLLRRWESAYGWIDVVRQADESLAIRQNLHYSFGSSKRSVARNYRQGHLPLLLHGEPAEVVFLGLGTGQTAAAALSHDAPRGIVVAELIPEVVEAARLMHATNLGLVDHPRVTVAVEDGRRFLHGQTKRFDVIVSDLFVPWESQTGYLYTVEHYRAARRALKPGGLFCQWLALYQLGPDDFETIADSFASVFPHVTLWWAEPRLNVAVLGLVGSDRAPDLAQACAARADLAARAQSVRGDPHLGSDGTMRALFIGRWTPRRPDRLNTDEHPRVEFAAPVSHAEDRQLYDELLRAYIDEVLSKLPKPEDAGEE
ncbi:MAG: fused MFS/spermidine synthase [Planctomycetes bacterium]|nr:fused MFS/spermidine synthase [Planctomycetota bacterium]